MGRSVPAAPCPRGSEYFKAEWFKSYDALPPTETLTVYGASDYAVTADGGDYTVHLVVGLDPEGHMYVLDVWRRQAASDRWIDAFCDLVLQWKPMAWAEEQGQIKAGVGPFLDRRQRDQADTLGLIGQMLDSIGYGETPKVVPLVRRDRYDGDEDDDAVNWKVI